MPNFLKTFWAGVGIKDYIYAALLLAAVGFASWYTIHERDIGAAKHAAQDAKLAALVAERNDNLKTIAALQQKKAGDKLDETLHTPVANPPVVRLCREPRPNSVPATPAVGPTGGRDPAPPAVGGEVALDPNAGALILGVGKDDDAEIAFLLSVIDALRAEMRGAK